MKKNSKQRLFEVMTRLDKTFKEQLNEGADKSFTLKGNEFPVYFKFEQYDKNGSLAVELWDEEGPFASVSSNLPESDTLPQDEFFLKNWGENELLAKELVDMGMVIPTGQDSEIGAQSYKIKPEYSQAGGVSEEIGDEGEGEVVSEDDDFFEITAPVNSEDAEMFVRIVNQGIDSHLEAFTKSKFDVRQGTLGTRRSFNFHKDELPILLRRLRELGTEEGDQWADDIENYDENLNEVSSMNEINYDDAQEYKGDHANRIKEALNEFNAKTVNVVRYANASLGDQKDVVCSTRVNVIANAYNEQNPFKLSIGLKLFGDNQDLIIIDFYENIKWEQVFYKDKWVTAEKDTLIFLEKFVRQAAPYVGLDEQTINAIVDDLNKQLRM